MIPIGSCEKHGHHVPLGVDSYTTMGAWNWRREGEGALFAPAALRSFAHHMGEAGWGTGSISFPPKSTGRSLRHRPEPDLRRFQQAGLRSHHGTNMEPRVNPATLRAETGCFLRLLQDSDGKECAVVADLMTVPPKRLPDGTRGELETSTTIAYMKEKGILERIRLHGTSQTGRAHAPRWMGPAFSKRTAPTPSSSRVRKTSLSHAPSRVFDTATIGNPLRSSEEQGKAVFKRIGDHLAAFLEEVKNSIQGPAEKRIGPAVSGEGNPP